MKQNTLCLVSCLFKSIALSFLCKFSHHFDKAKKRSWKEWNAGGKISSIYVLKKQPSLTMASQIKPIVELQPSSAIEPQVKPVIALHSNLSFVEQQCQLSNLKSFSPFIHPSLIRSNLIHPKINPTYQKQARCQILEVIKKHFKGHETP